MALILGVYDKMRFYVGDVPVDCSVHEQEVSVTIEGKQFKLSELQRTRLLPHVYVSLGKPTLESQQFFSDRQRRIVQKIRDNIPLSEEEEYFPNKMVPRILIEAPRDIKILRQKLYEESQAEKVLLAPANH